MRKSRTFYKAANQMLRRIKRQRFWAGYVGFNYLLGAIILTALAVMPTLNVDGANILGGGHKALGKPQIRA